MPNDRCSDDNRMRNPPPHRFFPARRHIPVCIECCPDSGHNLNFLLQILAPFTFAPLVVINWKEVQHMLGYNILSFPVVFIVRAAASRPSRNLPPLAVALSF